MNSSHGFERQGDLRALDKLPLENAADKQTTLAAAAQDEKVRSTITALANANRLTYEKADAWRHGTLDLSVEMQAVEQAKIEMLAGCTEPSTS
jgi:hypothetical protein